MKSTGDIQAFVRGLREVGFLLWERDGRLMYKAPKGLITEAVRQQLADRKTELLKFLRQTGRAGMPAILPVPPDRTRNGLPLSFAQQRLWFINQLEDLGPAYAMRRAYRIEGRFDHKVLERCVNEIIRRHEVLRTDLRYEGGQVHQHIAPALMLSIPLIDLRHLSGEAQERAVEQTFKTITEARTSWLQVTVLALADDVWILLLTMHHIVSDGWSMGVFFRELTALYSAFSAGRPSPLPDLHIQYADFAAWQRDWLQGPALADLLRYWQSVLEGAPTRSRLPSDRLRPAARSFHGATLDFALTPELSRRIEALTAASNVTLFMTLLSAFAVLLHRYTLEEDIIIGSAIANRNRAEIEPLIGFFVNMLALRIDLSEDPTFCELLERVKAVTLGAYDHQDLPFEKLVEELRPERRLDHNPLYQICFVLQNAPREEFRLDEATVCCLPLKHTTAKDELTLTCYLEDGYLRGEFEYSTDLFEESTIARMSQIYETLLEAIVDSPQQPISALPLVRPDTLAHARSFAPHSERPPPSPVCVHHAIEDQARLQPDAVAVLTEEGTLTYGALNRRANQLAHALRTQGVGPNQLVGLYLPRSVEMVVGLLGILKAGGAYLPLDPKDPKQHLRHIADDAALTHLVTLSSVDLSWMNDRVTRLYLDKEAPLAGQPADDPSHAAAPGHLAYVMYTSGSTGLPKGVMISHGSLAAFSAAACDLYGLRADDRVLQFSSLSFDISVEEIFPCLQSGATLVLRSEAMAHSISHFLEQCRAWEISVIDVPTAFWNQLVAELDKPYWALPASTRLVIIGGERAEAKLVAKWRRRVDGHPALMNTYGPTEATVVATYHDLTASSGADIEMRDVPIGKPLPYAETYVLDSHLRPVPVTVPGELYIGGTGVALGYLNQPEATKERFIPNPFSSTPGARLFKTGDRVRCLPDGNLVFLERIDRQVKIRGFRVELGAVEATLAAHPMVRQAVVSVRTLPSGSQDLVAYLVAEQEPGQTATSAAALGKEQIGRWRTLFEDSYHQPSQGTDPTLKTVGWNSSYTNSSIPMEEMRAWISGTVSRIQRLQPRCLLEIGCGTGLLLFRLAPLCHRYLGTDFSATALAGIRREIERLGLTNVTLEEREADQFSGIPTETFDTVVLNSVIQYFPNVQYLLRVLHGAIDAVPSGGKLFVGDVRNLGLLEAFHTSVELQKAAPGVPLPHLRALVEKKIAQEEELLLDPLFFYALARQSPRIQDVQVLLKRGRDDNEMTRFRYDVILHLDEAKGSSIRWHALAWERDQLTLSALRRLLLETDEAGVHVRDIGNLRVARALRASLLLKEKEERATTLSGLLATLNDEPAHAEDPEDFWELGESLGWHVQVCWAASGQPGRFDVFLSRSPLALPPVLRSRAGLSPLHEYANNPLQSIMASRLSAELRSHMSRNLPDYMQPAAYAFLDTLPLTARGKVDWKALPVPTRARPVMDELVPPQTAVEKSLAAIWQSLLDLDFVGIHDDFFALGGHSLLAVLLVSRVQELFQVTLGVRTLFESPTIARFAAAVEAALAGPERLQGPPLHPVPRTEELPASFAQQRFWFMHQLEGAHAAYNISCALRWTGHLDIPVLEMSIREIVRRHEILRTTFRNANGRPVQIIAPPPTAALLHVTNVRALPAPARDEMVRKRIQEAVRAPFDMAEGPLLRMELLCCAEEDHVFILTLHHSIADAWSVGLFMKELSAVYAAYLHHLPSPLPDLTIQYADFAVWQRALLAGGTWAAQRRYWQEQLAGAPPLLELPTDHPRPAVQRYQGASVHFVLPADVYRELVVLSRREEVTLFMTLLSAFQTLLYRYTGQEDLVVSTGNATRAHPKLEALIGCFINIIALRTRLAGDLPFLDLLRQVREVTLQAYTHQDIPFEQVVQALDLPRNLSYHPVAQVMLILQNAPASPLALPGVTATPISIEGETAQLDLNVQLWETGDGLEGYFAYNTDLFERETVIRMRDCFVTLLRGLVADPKTPLSALPLLSPGERQRQLIEWNATQTPFPENSCLHQLFEQRARAQPDAVAICYQHERITYDSLDRQANRLACHLRSRGVGPDVVVGLCMDRSVEMVVGMLGILKAQGAYLPLDPSYPLARLRFMLEDTSVRLVVAQEHLRELFAGLDLGLVYLDADAPAPAADPPVGASPNNLAYLIFTSGSTGEPKAIALNHLGVVNNITDLNRRYDIGPSDKVLVLSSLSFDMCVYEVLGVLAAGGTLVVPEQAQVREPAVWASLIQIHGVTIWNSAPALLEMLVDYAEPRPNVWPRSLRVAFLGGDWIPVSLPDRLRAMTEKTQIVCMGGATEVSIHSILYDVEAVDPRWKSIPYGKPMANQHAFILDENGQPVPIGVPGELYLGGIGLARGYHNRPEQTRMKFVNAVFPEGNGARLYKTGDRARFLPDGTIELLGRMDFQVKFLGHRIELEEIAAALQSHPAIQHAVAVVTGNPMDVASQRLLAYHVVAHGASSPDPASLRLFLQNILPSHMVPSAFYALKSLPLTPNGKVDRLRLTAPAPTPDATPTVAEQAPCSALESVIAMVWGEVLGTEHIGVDDNFFALGGHSLTGTQIVSRLQSLLPLRIPLRALFQRPTIRELAEALEAESRQAGVDLAELAAAIMEVHALSEEELDDQLR